MRFATPSFPDNASTWDEIAARVEDVLGNRAIADRLFQLRGAAPLFHPDLDRLVPCLVFDVDDLPQRAAMTLAALA